MNNLPHPKTIKALKELKAEGMLSPENRKKIVQGIREVLKDLEKKTNKKIVKNPTN